MKAKKLLSLLFAMIMLFSITACSEAGGDPEEPKVSVYLTTKCVEESGVSTTYEYDDAGNMVKSVRLSADGSEIMRSEWVYDGAGNKIEEKQFSSGEYVGSYKYTYDQKNHISSEVFYDEDGVEFSRSEYQCDDSGNVIP
jgi:YD repeat-containing protein